MTLRHAVWVMIIPTAATAMTQALTSFEKASQKLVSAVSGGTEDAPSAIVDMVEAKAQFSAGVGMVKIGDEMMRELLNIVSNDRR